MMNTAKKRLNENLAVLFLFLPLAMHWLLPEGPKWEQAFTTIGVGPFRYSWVVVFYLVYFALYPKYPAHFLFGKIRRILILGFAICPIALMFMNSGDYFVGLYLSAIPFFLVPCVIISKPPQEMSFKILKIPLFFILGVSLLFYFKVARDIYTSGLLEERPTTLVGSVNISSYFIVVLSCLISELYIKSERLKIALLLFVTVLIVIGACRGALLLMGLYVIILLIRSYRKTKWYLKFLLVAILSFSIYYVFTSDLFTFLSMRNEELTEQGGGDYTSGRGERIGLVMNNAFRASPLIGVGHGRVFPSSKDLLERRDMHNFHYSKYAGAPHNIYVVAIAEYGIIGAIMVIVALLFILKVLDFRNNLSYLVVLMLFTMGNTEAILIQDDFWPLFWIIVAISAKKSRNIRTINRNGSNSFLPTSVSPNAAQ